LGANNKINTINKQFSGGGIPFLSQDSTDFGVGYNNYLGSNIK
jgi:hypothetical protein